MVSSRMLERQFGAINAETLGVIDQVGRGVEPVLCSNAPGKSLRGANAAFAVGSGHVEAAQTSLGIAHSPANAHPDQFQLDVAGILLIDMVKNSDIAKLFLGIEMWKTPATGASTSRGEGHVSSDLFRFCFGRSCFLEIFSSEKSLWLELPERATSPHRPDRCSR